MPQPYSRASNTSRRWQLNDANPDIDLRPRLTAGLHKATTHRRLGNYPQSRAKEAIGKADLSPDGDAPSP